MSHGQHRTPKPRRIRRLRTLAAGLGIAAAAATGITLTTGLTADLTATPQDTGWGAPDTTTVIATDNAGTTADTQVSVQPFDTGWG